MTQIDLLSAPVSRSTLCEKLAAHFKALPNVDIDARELLRVAGFGGWRTRLSELRFPPYNMVIVNRPARRKLADGTTIRDSFYRYIPEDTCTS